MAQNTFAHWVKPPIFANSKELFELALQKTGLTPDEVIHIGDSISSDVKGASALGINTLWLNRFGKSVPDGVKSISRLPEALNFSSSALAIPFAR